MALDDLKLTFQDEFDTLSLDTGTSETDANFWNTTMYNGTVRSLYNNGEQQWYADPDHNGLGINPFSVKDGVLTITARPTTAAEKSKLYGYNYVSGALTSEHEFSQKYGYFEIRAQVPEGKGLWPAFWLLADHNGWPPEIDVMESIGDQTNYSHQTVHTDAGDGGGKATWNDEKYSEGWHTYGMDWTKDTITFYIDGKETWSTATPDDMHSPMYMLMNLAIGGSWAGPPNSATEFPAEYKIDYVRAYQHTGEAGSGGVLPPDGDNESTTTAATDQTDTSDTETAANSDSQTAAKTDLKTILAPHLVDASGPKAVADSDSQAATKTDLKTILAPHLVDASSTKAVTDSESKTASKTDLKTILAPDQAGTSDTKTVAASDKNVTLGPDADVVSLIAGAHAIITDFNHAMDRIELKGASADEVNVHTKNGSTLIDLNGVNTATLAGVTLSADQLNLSYV